MQRLVRILVVAAWIAGAVIGGLPDQPTASAPSNESAQVLVDTDYVQLEANRSHATLTITTPWQSTWRATAPTPAMIATDRSAKRAGSEAAAPPSVVPFVIRSLVPLL
jgi:hypothetical protein